VTLKVGLRVTEGHRKMIPFNLAPMIFY